MKAVFFALVAVCVLASQMIAASPVGDGNGDLSTSQRQAIASLATYILKIASSNDYSDYLSTEKRNAEVLNSLIGLPRLLKDKGR
ncbi:pigment-dispersing hormone peptides-like [Paramacrobiotus metropolitanus]|uniref:pigment-dispersing hormone peptides-like n=1 Tax=Paramacrobiotus metropolitanus TaxID=2943436 RepID=UPI0024459710|nr:pigment-dispersing hormone peptides-like [Paramacrobiotus metropolitanus]